MSFEKHLSHVEMEIWCANVQLAVFGDATADLLTFSRYVSPPKKSGDIKFRKGGILKVESVSILSFICRQVRIIEFAEISLHLYMLLIKKIQLRTVTISVHGLDGAFLRAKQYVYNAKTGSS